MRVSLRHLRVFDDDWNEVAGCDDCGDCGLQTVLTVDALEVGDYWLVVEGYKSFAGEYSVEIEQVWEDGALCGLGTTCDHCANTATYWYSKAMTACGTEARWGDGALCGLGTSCNACDNPATYWPSKVFTACGAEPCWGTGTRCGKWTTEHQCCGGATCPWWWVGGCVCN